MTTKLFPVPARGVGRRDNSCQVEAVSYATMKGLQYRYQATAKFVLDTLAFPDFYVSLYQFVDLEGNLVYAAPDIPYHLYSVECTGETPELMFAGIYRFDTYDDIWIWNVDEWYGDVYGYGKVKLQYSKGIRTVEGKYYLMALAQWAAAPTVVFNDTDHMLREDVRF